MGNQKVPIPFPRFFDTQVYNIPSINMPSWINTGTISPMKRAAVNRKKGRYLFFIDKSI
jgi:hypothetical protein